MATVLLLSLMGVGSGHGQAGNGDVVYHLHGSVQDGVTGKPIARALVSTADRRLATMTNSEGRFAMEVSVPPHAGRGASAAGSGDLILQAQRPGYLFSKEPLQLPLDETLSTSEASLFLFPTASIKGTVATAEADSAREVRVLLLRHQVTDGERTWVQFGQRQTDSRGQFTFNNLAPGEYSVMSAEWRGNEAAGSLNGTLSEEYPPVFFGDVPSLEGAGKVHLHYGETAAADLHLHRAPYYPVRVPVARNAKGAPAQVMVRITGANRFGGFELGYNSRDGVVEGALPDGHYTLLLHSFGSPEESGFLRLALNVAGGPVAHAAVALEPLKTLQVRVRVEFEHKDSAANKANLLVYSGRSSPPVQGPPVQVLLTPEDEKNEVAGNPRPLGPEELTIESVPSGWYRVQAMPLQGYVASLRAGSVDLLHQPLPVSAGSAAEPIEVTLRDDTGTLHGTVTAESGSNAERSFFYLLPTGSAGRFVEGSCGRDGRFTLSNVAPGSYRVLAFRGAPAQIAYREPDVVNRFEGKGTQVTVVPGSVQELAVPLLNELDAEEQ